MSKNIDAIRDSLKKKSLDQWPPFIAKPVRLDIILLESLPRFLDILVTSNNITNIEGQIGSGISKYSKMNWPELIMHFMVACDVGLEAIDRILDATESHPNIYKFHSLNGSKRVKNKVKNGLYLSAKQLVQSRNKSMFVDYHLYKDLCALMCYGHRASINEYDDLSNCNMELYLGKPNLIYKIFGENYIKVSRIVKGSINAQRGCAVENFVISYLKKALLSYSVNKGRRECDIIINKPGCNNNYHIECNFQIGGNSTIERKAKDAIQRCSDIHGNGDSIAYLLGGNGTFKRKEFVNKAILHSDYTLTLANPPEPEFIGLVDNIKEFFDGQR